MPARPTLFAARARDRCGGEDRAPGFHAEHERYRKRQYNDRRAGRQQRAPAPGREQHQRDHQAELRFVGEQAEQDAGNDRPPIEPQQRKADQRRGEEAVMPVTEIDEHGREGEGEEERYPSPEGGGWRVQRAGWGACVR